MLNFVRKALGLGFKCITKGNWVVAIDGITGWSGAGLPKCDEGYKNRDEARKAAQAMASALEETDAEYDRACLARIRQIKACRAAGLDPWQTAEEWAVAA